MNAFIYRRLAALIIIYAAASLVHFVHNAEFLAQYPNLPASWSRTDLYVAWAVMSGVGLVGWGLLRRGYEAIGLLVLAGYAALGLDSLGHYIVATPGEHTVAMNWTILGEVSAAVALLIALAIRMVRRVQRRAAP